MKFTVEQISENDPIEADFITPIGDLISAPHSGAICQWVIVGREQDARIQQVKAELEAELWAYGRSPSHSATIARIAALYPELSQEKKE